MIPPGYNVIAENIGDKMKKTVLDLTQEERESGICLLEDMLTSELEVRKELGEDRWIKGEAAKVLINELRKEWL